MSKDKRILDAYDIAEEIEQVLDYYSQLKVKGYKHSDTWHLENVTSDIRAIINNVKEHFSYGN